MALSLIEFGWMLDKLNNKFINVTKNVDERGFYQR